MPAHSALIVAAACGASALQAPGARPDGLIRAAELRAHVARLASDELAGRATGTPGAAAAAAYLAGELEALGLEPGGDSGTFLQDCGLERLSWSAPPRVALLGEGGERTELAWGTDFDLPSEAGPVAGVLALSVAAAEGAGAKEALPAPALDRALFLEGGEKARAERLEAAGCPDAAGFALLVTAGSDEPGRARSGLPRAAVRPVRLGAPVLRLRGTALAAVRAGAVAALEVELSAESAEDGDQNVIAILRGVGSAADPSLAEQCIVVSAHYDHLGVRAPIAPAIAPPGTSASNAGDVEDLCYNGADDDASGCAAVLELAGALAAGPRPARTVVFLFAVGEELGLLGTFHYLEHPSWPLERTVFNFNLEMIGRPDAKAGGPGRLWLTGHERTNLGEAWSAAGLAIAADPYPEQHFFERSDNIAFCRRGVVGLTLSSYDLHADYHQVSDELETLDFEHLEAAARVALAALASVVSGELTPRWLEGQDPRKPSAR